MIRVQRGPFCVAMMCGVSGDASPQLCKHALIGLADNVV